MLSYVCCHTSLREALILIEQHISFLRNDLTNLPQKVSLKNYSQIKIYLIHTIRDYLHLGGE